MNRLIMNPYSFQMAGGQQIIHVTLEPDQAGWRLDRALAAAVPTLSRERLKALIRNRRAHSTGSRPRDQGQGRREHSS